MTPIVQLRKLASQQGLKPFNKYPAYCTRAELESALGMTASLAVGPNDGEPDLAEMIEAPEVTLLSALTQFVQVRGGSAEVTQEQIDRISARLETIKDELQEQVQKELVGVLEAVKKQLAKHRRIEVVVNKGEPVKLSGRAHKKFEDVLRVAAARVNVMVVGPAGCGKTHLAEQIAEALQLPFYSISLTAGISEAALLGRYIPGTTDYVKAPFVRAYETGGVFLIDEMDSADPNALLVINSALANGHLNLPSGEMVRRHADFVCIASANTYGKGADRQYVGRAQLDASSLDRFSAGTFTLEYDEELERELTGDSELCKWAQEIRAKAERSKIRQVVSTRFIIEGERVLATGVKIADLQKRFLSSWSDNDRRAVA